MANINALSGKRFWVVVGKQACDCCVSAQVFWSNWFTTALHCNSLVNLTIRPKAQISANKNRIPQHSVDAQSTLYRNKFTTLTRILQHKSWRKMLRAFAAMWKIFLDRAVGVQDIISHILAPAPQGFSLGSEWLGRGGGMGLLDGIRFRGSYTSIQSMALTTYSIS